MTLDETLGLFRRFHHTGSRYCCKPAPKDTDDDIVCLVSWWKHDRVRAALGADDWVLGVSREKHEFSSGFSTSRFHSYRKGDVNLIVTPHLTFYDKFVFATKLCAKLNLLKKDDRIAVFQAILYDKV